MVQLVKESDDILLKEGTRNTPFIQITKYGNIVISGNVKDPSLDKLFLSLFWGTNKILSNSVTVTLDIDILSVKAVKNIFLLLRVLSNQVNINEIVVIWLYSDEEELDLIETYKEALPLVKFLNYKK